MQAKRDAALIATAGALTWGGFLMGQGHEVGAVIGLVLVVVATLAFAFLVG